MENVSFDVDFFRKSISEEKIIYLDFGYLASRVEETWEYITNLTPMHIAKFQLIQVFLKHCTSDHISYFNKLGSRGISAVCISSIFKTDCPKLSFLVHEALSELFALNDIKYPYEDHKKVYLKNEGIHYKNWGNGYGEITPHSDDLYEDIDTNYLSLTVCRDSTNTPTKFYLPKDIFVDFTDEEIRILANMKVKFISGKNVNASKSRVRSIINYSEESGYQFCLDFRIDTDLGDRMLVVDKHDNDLINKLRNSILVCTSQESISKTGTFLIADNYKVLHARGQMNVDVEKIIQHDKPIDYLQAPRLLYRSKGQDCKLTSYL